MRRSACRPTDWRSSKSAASSLRRNRLAHLLIAEARFYAHLNDMLLEGARGAIEAAGHSHETITVPGALELPCAIALAAESGKFDAYVTLAAVIDIDTYHFEIAPRV